MKIDINLLASYKITNKHVTTKSKASYLILAIAIILSAIIATTTMLFIAFNINDEVLINNLKSELNTYEIESAEIQLTTNQLDKVNARKTLMQNVTSTIDALQMLDKNDFSAVFSSLPSDVTIEQISYSQSVLRLSCVGKSKDSPSQCAQNLSKKGITANISYSGFNSTEIANEDGQVTDLEVKFSITCAILAEKDGALE